jgi:hypothetical protein
MSLYFVTALSDAEKVLAAAKTLVPESDFLEVSDDKFFLKFEGTSVELSRKIGFAEGTTGTGIILLVSAYNGRAPKSVWEWITQKMSAK